MMRLRIIEAGDGACVFAAVVEAGGEVMQRLTVPERLLVVALVPALALLARETFGPLGQTASLWSIFSIAIALLSIGLALFVARSLTLPIREATVALDPLIAAGTGPPADQLQPRGEIARLGAAIGELVTAAAGRQ